MIMGSYLFCNATIFLGRTPLNESLGKKDWKEEGEKKKRKKEVYGGGVFRIWIALDFVFFFCFFVFLFWKVFIAGEFFCLWVRAEDSPGKTDF